MSHHPAEEQVLRPVPATRAGRPRKARVASLDVARGWMLLVSVAMLTIATPPPRPLVHATWEGIRAFDLVFPLFVSLSGVGMAFAYRNRVSHWVSLRRVVVLLVVGLVYGGLTSGNWDPATFRFTGTLQLYAALVALLALGHLVLHGWRAWAGLTLGAGTAMAVFMRAWASGCPGGELTPACNPSGTLDTAVLGVHMYARGQLGHDPEGMVSILGAFITAAAGVTAGHMALDVRRTRPQVGPMMMAGWAATLAVWGYALTWLVPAFKRLWTPSFALSTAALGVLLLAAAFLVFDVTHRWLSAEDAARLATPFAAMGRNSLLVYFGSHLLIVLLKQIGDPSLPDRLESLLGSGTVGLVVFSLADVAFWWWLAIVLHRHRIYVHA